VSVSHQADPHTGTDAVNDPALIALRCVGAGHRGAISPCRRRVPVPLRRHGLLVDELPCELRGNQTSPSRATGEMSFFMVYGAEAVLPPEVTIGSLRVKTYDEAAQDQLRREDIDLVDERRWQSPIKNARYQQALKRYHQRFVRSRELQVDDLVLRWILNWEGMNKLSPSWEGPF
jgi:hypothetical protein